jgi:PhzF family phenazine biosynthesis protein
MQNPDGQLELLFTTLDVFAPIPFTGNPAAVLIFDAKTDKSVNDELKQKIAAEFNLSDTAFVVPFLDEAATYGLRWFTPKSEVPLCGHATLAAAQVIFESQSLAPSGVNPGGSHGGC